MRVTLDGSVTSPTVIDPSQYIGGDMAVTPHRVYFTGALLGEPNAVYAHDLPP